MTKPSHKSLRKIVKFHLQTASNTLAFGEIATTLTNYRLAFSILLTHSIKLSTQNTSFYTSEIREFSGLLQNHSELKQTSLVSDLSTNSLCNQVLQIEHDYNLTSLDISADNLPISDIIRLDFINALNLLADFFKGFDNFAKATICYQMIYSQTRRLINDDIKTSILNKSTRDLAIALYSQAHTTSNTDDSITFLRHAANLFNDLANKTNLRHDVNFCFDTQKETAIKLITKCIPAAEAELSSGASQFLATIINNYKNAVTVNSKIDNNHSEFVAHQKIFITLLIKVTTLLMKKTDMTYKIYLSESLIKEYNKIKGDLSEAEQEKLMQTRRLLLSYYKTAITSLMKKKTIDAMQEALVYINATRLELKSIPWAVRLQGERIEYAIARKQNSLATIFITSIIHTQNINYAIAEINKAIFTDGIHSLFSENFFPRENFELSNEDLNEFYDLQHEFVSILKSFITNIQFNFNLLETTCLYYKTIFEAIEKLPENLRNNKDSSTLATHVNEFFNLLRMAYAATPFVEHPDNVKAIKILHMTIELLNKIPANLWTPLHTNQRAILALELQSRENILHQQEFLNGTRAVPPVLTILTPLSTPPARPSTFVFFNKHRPRQNPVKPAILKPITNNHI
jgi:hypothetical protein